MPPGPGLSDWSIDLDEEASLVEIVAGAALLVAALVLAGLGLVHVFGRHPSRYWFFGALALAGAGLLVLLASFAAGAVLRHVRRPRWSGSVDTTTPGVLLFLLEPTAAVRGRADATTRLGDVRCRVSPAGGPEATAPDDRISRVRGLLMTRYHPSFFAGVPEPASGTYEFRWDERDGEEWRTLLAGSVEVEVRAPSADDPDWGRELAAMVGSRAGEHPPAAPAAEAAPYVTTGSAPGAEAAEGPGPAGEEPAAPATISPGAAQEPPPAAARAGDEPVSSITPDP